MSRIIPFVSALLLIMSIPAVSASAELGAETVSLIKKGVFHLSCDDAVSIATLLKADGYKPVEYLIIGGEHETEFRELPEGTQNALISFTNAMDVFVNSISTPFGAKEEVIGTIETNIMGRDIENLMTAATATYLGVVPEKDFDTYVNVNFCGDAAPSGYKSPLDISEDAIVQAIEDKIIKSQKQK